MTLKWDDITVHEGGCFETPCDCCGKTTMSVRGDLETPDGWIGFYITRWTFGHPERFPEFIVSIGDWSDTGTVENRWVFGAEYNKEERAFRLLDMADDIGERNATLLNRTDVIGTPFADEAFAMIDAVFMNDSRLEALRA